MDLIAAGVELTPTVLAKAFWQMGSDQQAEFLTELARVIEEYHEANRPRSWAWSLGEMQWYALAKELRGEDGRCNKAGEMLMALSAPMYLHTLRAN